MIDVTYRPPEAPGYLPSQAFEATARSSLPNATKERRAHGIEETQGPVDLLELSPEAERRIRMDSVDRSEAARIESDLDSEQTEIGVGDVRKHQTDEENGSTQELTDDQKREVEELQHRDRQVAANASQMLAQAQREVSNKQFGEPESPSVSDVYSSEPEQNPPPNEVGTSVDEPPHVTPNPLFDVYERSFSTEFSKQQPGTLLDVTS